MCEQGARWRERTSEPSAATATARDESLCLCHHARDPRGPNVGRVRHTGVRACLITAAAERGDAVGDGPAGGRRGQGLQLEEGAEKDASSSFSSPPRHALPLADRRHDHAAPPMDQFRALRRQGRLRGLAAPRKTPRRPGVGCLLSSSPLRRSPKRTGSSRGWGGSASASWRARA